MTFERWTWHSRSANDFCGDTAAMQAYPNITLHMNDSLTQACLILVGQRARLATVDKGLSWISTSGASSDDTVLNTPPERVRHLYLRLYT